MRKSAWWLPCFGAVLGGLVLASPQRSVAQETQTGFLDREVVVDGRASRYQVYVPRAYDASRPSPAILFLHGAGERGEDGLAQTDVGLGRAIRMNPERWPAIVVMPQVPEEETWVGWSGRVAMAALDATASEFAVDASRVYLTGLSMGGQGTWSLAYAYPERFAAVVAICGFLPGGPRFPSFIAADVADPFAAVAERLGHLPIWIFHGDADPTVPVDQSRRMAGALEAVGADVRYTELAGVGHNAWDPAYGTPALAAWLFERRRDAAPGR